MVFSKKPLRFIIATLVAFLPLVSSANPTVDSTQVSAETTHVVEAAHGENTEPKDVKTEIKEFIDHHLKDSYDFNIFGYKDEAGKQHHVGFPLPVILLDNGLQVFSSSKFHNDNEVAEVNGTFYKLHHGKIYKVDSAEGEVTMDEHHHATNEKPLDFSITKNVFMIFVVALIMFLLFKSLAKSYVKNGGIASGVGRIFEPIVLYVRDEIAIPNIGEKHYKKYMSYLLTIFFFIWFLNIFGLTPLGINVTGNIAVTACLALITYLITTFTAKKDYWGHIFWMPGVPVPMKFILAPIELLGTIIKPFSLMIRLYANIVAGHIVLMSLIGLMFVFKNWIGSSLSFFLSFAISLIEILVALLQAYIFTMLSALYFGSAVEEHHHDEAHH
ncbi:F0F1 ATP synthase subunit A [Flavobacterium sp. J49]|uniref:F0F1 ATP synthase subunit A n=1 Tax=Flavobacterium sp. J49 TaxID=2718534 RepID=UPI001594115D|nr:F0F1 ATP synthase subunit A [Flavobacterium sp. J49]MBF6641495.1 F0F1 ATP synthase subunit A [Flavobacterium sp. J49]NIC02742.1 F0F1 ATP synthase subunit A [Flavobacterium sp. J49]